MAINGKLVEAAARFLADCRSGAVTDAAIVGTNPGSSPAYWFHHYSVQADEDMVQMVGEVTLFLDEMRASVHATRRAAATVAGAGSISGLRS